MKMNYDTNIYKLTYRKKLIKVKLLNLSIIVHRLISICHDLAFCQGERLRISRAISFCGLLLVATR